MWLMILGGLSMFIVSMIKYYKETNAGNVAVPPVPNLVPGKEQNRPQEKLTISTIQGELVPPRID